MTAKQYILSTLLVIAAVRGAAASAAETGVTRPAEGRTGPVTTVTPAAAARQPEAWRLAGAVGSPPWLVFDLEERARLETLSGDFRPAATGDGAALVNRVLLHAGVRTHGFIADVELVDSRGLAAPGTLLTTSIIDPLDLLRLQVGLQLHGLAQPGDRLTVTLGRQTLDMGSRRLQARNEFRNTINAFTGLEATYRTADGHLVRAFATVPVLRFPTDAESLAANRRELDQENFDQLWWGLFFEAAQLPGGLRVEGYLFGLHERDAVELPTTNRNLWTPGARLWRPPATGQVDFQVELMGQLGTSRASSRDSDVYDRAHLAGSLHLQVGYRAGLPGAPRLALVYDVASGDGDPDDGQSNRFDPLYGARRFEWGPTDLYGALGRTNISSPGVRLELAPHPAVDGFVAWRAAWLASPRDAWVAAGVRDPSGASGSFVGHQVEGRIRVHFVPRTLSLDVGAAVLLPGDFARATQRRRWDESTFVYLQWTAWV